MTPEARAALPKSIYFPLPTDDDIYRNRLVSKGAALGRGDEAIAVYDDLIARFGTATELSLREPVANALFKKGITLGTPDPQTNILYFDVKGTGLTNHEFIKRLEARDVSMSPIGESVRAVTHLDVTRDDCQRAVEIAHQVVG